MAPPVDHVHTDPSMPATTHAVVIGGGIIGVCTAFFLARKGIPVVLCEKGEIAGEQSSRNWGWCRKMGRDPREVPLAMEALRLWPEMNTLVGAETGFRRSGIVYLCRTQKGAGEAGGMAAAGRQTVPARQPAADARPDEPGAARPGRTVAGGAVHAERRQGGTGACGTGDRGGGAAVGGDDPDPVRGTGCRNPGRTGRRRRYGEG